MDVLIVVDMQVGLLEGDPKHDLEGVLDRINSLSEMVRGKGGNVVWIRHCGSADDGFAPNTPGWSILPALECCPKDVVVDKTLNDPFTGTALQTTLQGLSPDRVLITGWATDFCIDATVRSAVSHNYNVVVVTDGHTVSDRPHLDAASVIRHHNWIWSGLITKASIMLATTSHLLEERIRRS